MQRVRPRYEKPIYTDVAIEFTEILPRLAAGVIVHVHDMSFPNLAKWGPKLKRGGQHEQFCVQAVLAQGACFDPLWHGATMGRDWLQRTSGLTAEQQARMNTEAREYLGGAGAERLEGGTTGTRHYEPDGTGDYAGKR